MTAMIIHGDARTLPLPDASVDAIVCDPPYGLEFMNKKWDKFRPSAARIRTRVDGRTNPGEGKSTTSTPEAYVAGRPFQEWCEQWGREALRVLKPGGHLLAFGGTRTSHRLVCGLEDAGFEIRDSMAWLYGQGFPKSPNVAREIDRRRANVGNDTALRGPVTGEAFEWAGWKTALKPGFEPMVVARKPLIGTIAANILAYGTGALNIDACRVEAGQDYLDKCASVVGIDTNRNGHAYGEWTGTREDSSHPGGRWPPNVVLDDSAADELDRQSGASRFFPVFRYEAKAPKSERPVVGGVAHSTVKPLALMRWLIRLVTPPGGLVLDPFAGSGTTLEAALHEGFNAIGIEQDPAYLPLIRLRITRGGRRGQRPRVPRPRSGTGRSGQPTLF